MEPSVVDARNDLRAKLLRQPWWLEYTAGLFPVIAIVFLLRSFLFEPFRIPSGSMLPTLHVGDFILVNKYDYGLRLPVANTKVLEIGAPKRGDVIVFRYPVDTSIDYIKRVVGVPGDTVEYRNKVLYVNGVEQKLAAPRDFIDENTMVTLTEYDETLGDVTHLVAFDHRRPSWVPEGAISKKEPSCTYNDAGFICKVPEGHYFAMGDNRDNSEDSRYWGFVPDENLVGARRPHLGQLRRHVARGRFPLKSLTFPNAERHRSAFSLPPRSPKCGADVRKPPDGIKPLSNGRHSETTCFHSTNSKNASAMRSKTRNCSIGRARTGRFRPTTTNASNSSGTRF